MGCIETCQNDEQDMEVARLTLTWDVLKHLLVPYVPPQKVD